MEPHKNVHHIVIDARIRPSSTGRYMDRLLQHLQAIDTANRYTILVRPDDSWQPTASNFTTVICGFKQFSFNFLDQYTFAKFIKKLRPDLVHFGMTPQEPVFYSGARVTTLHDLTMLRFARPGKLPAWVHAIRMLGYKYLLRTSLKKASRVIVPTEYVKSDVTAYMPKIADKLTVTLEASEPPLDIQPEAPNVADLDKFILYVGSAFPHKNLDTLVKAFEIIHSSDSEIKLLLVGKKEHHYEHLETAVQQSPARENIVFTGFVTDAELKWLYQNAAVYVFPSLSEGFGLPALEAMAHGCPVASSNATCLPEVSGDAAIYFDPNNLDDIAQTVTKVMTDDALRQDLIAKGNEQVKKFSWRRMARQTLSVYDEILNKS